MMTLCGYPSSLGAHFHVHLSHQKAADSMVSCLSHTVPIEPEIRLRASRGDQPGKLTEQAALTSDCETDHPSDKWRSSVFVEPTSRHTHCTGCRRRFRSIDRSPGPFQQ
jgi:hypothetical protein